MSFEDIYDKHKDGVVDHTPAIEPKEASEAPKSDDTSGGGTLPPIEMGSATLGEYFGYSDLESHAPGMKNKLDEIYLMVRGLGHEDVEDYLMALEQKIGDPKLGISRADHIYQYLKLASRASEAYKDLEKYENKGGSNGRQQQNTLRASGGNDEGGDERGDVGGDN